jgi:hypothetical protein
MSSYDTRFICTSITSLLVYTFQEQNITQVDINIFSITIFLSVSMFLTLFFGAAMGSEKAKNGRAKLTNPFL